MEAWYEKEGSTALLMREDGATYREIGERLDCSSGKAHHLVRLAAEQRAASGEDPDAIDTVTQLSAHDRVRRDHLIVLARLKRVPVSRVAQDHNVSERTVRRVMKRWRSRPHSADRESVAYAMAQIQQLQAQYEQSTSAARTRRPSLRQIERRRVHLQEMFGLMRDAGVVTPEAVTAAARMSIDRVIEINLAVRSRLEAMLRWEQVPSSSRPRRIRSSTPPAFSMATRERDETDSN